MQKKDYNTEYIGESDGSVTLKHTQKVDHIIDTNKELQNQDQTGNDMKLAARVPMSVIHQWQKEGIDMSLVGTDPEMTAKFWKKLQDPEWANLRVWKGRVV
ncbi:hypothetical protein NVP1262O_14 [Vibrio phage 1.262.O._10N.286.51.A9]|nr:hypothetical protein NVP1262O_14 [Vibrio phage 1.262.O._10N.286.51.A9]